MGKDVTLLHKLLKNKIDGYAYMLFSEAFDVNNADGAELNFEAEKNEYEGAGVVRI